MYSEEALQTPKVLELLRWLAVISLKNVCLYDKEGTGSLALLSIKSLLSLQFQQCVFLPSIITLAIASSCCRSTEEFKRSHNWKVKMQKIVEVTVFHFYFYLGSSLLTSMQATMPPRLCNCLMVDY